MVRASVLPLVLLAGCLPPSAFDIVATEPESSSTEDTAGSSGSSSTTEGDSSSTSGGEGGSGSTGTAGSSDSTAMTSGTTASSSGTTDTTSGGEPVCGNGVVEAGEECEGDERCFECVRDRWIYVSAAEHSAGDLNGIDGADSLCRQYSLQSGAADDTWKNFIAWISDSEHDMVERLPDTIRGRFVRTDGVVVAESVDELFSGMLAAPINLDEHGQFAEHTVITGTRPDGSAVPSTHCENWTSQSALDDSAHVGFSEATDGNWTMYKDPFPCLINGLRLYCLEAQ